MVAGLTEAIVQSTGLLSVIIMPIILAAYFLISFGKHRIMLSQNPESTIGVRPPDVPHISETANKAPRFIDDELIGPKVLAQHKPEETIKNLLKRMNKPTSPQLLEEELPAEAQEHEEKRPSTKTTVSEASESLSEAIEKARPELSIELELPKNQRIKVYGKDWIIKEATIKVKPPQKTSTENKPPLTKPAEEEPEAKSNNAADEEATDENQQETTEAVKKDTYKPAWLKVDKKKPQSKIDLEEEEERKDAELTS